MSKTAYYKLKHEYVYSFDVNHVTYIFNCQGFYMCLYKNNLKIFRRKCCCWFGRVQFVFITLTSASLKTRLKKMFYIIKWRGFHPHVLRAVFFWWLFLKSIFRKPIQSKRAIFIIILKTISLNWIRNRIFKNFYFVLYKNLKQSICSLNVFETVLIYRKEKWQLSANLLLNKNVERFIEFELRITTIVDSKRFSVPLRSVTLFCVIY